MSSHASCQSVRNIQQMLLIMLLGTVACCAWAGTTFSSVTGESVSFSEDIHVASGLPAEQGAAKRTPERSPQDDNRWKPLCASTQTSQNVIDTVPQALPTVLYACACLTDQIHSPQAARAPPRA